MSDGGITVYLIQNQHLIVTLLSDFDARVIFCVRYLMEINAKSRGAFPAIAAMAPWSSLPLAELSQSKWLLD